MAAEVAKRPVATNQRLLLVVGASGYVGGRLLTALASRGERVRAMARRPEELRSRVPAGIEVVSGDVLDVGSLPSVLEGVDTAYYLIHAMASPRDFEREERTGAEHFAAAARAAGVRRIVYLGGLGSDDLSPHLASRQNVGRILRDQGVATTEFRASIILGSGSLSFELVRSLVERLPVLIVPQWASRLTQPIAIEDLIAYLVAALDVVWGSSEVVEIGGTDRVSYLDLMREYARQRSLTRRFIPVPVLTPWLSSKWLGLVTPVYARVGRKLIDSLRSETVVTSQTAPKLFPGIRPRGMRDAIARALANEDREFAETRWSDARSSIGHIHHWGGAASGSRLLDSRAATVVASPDAAFRAIERIGGSSGWYYGNWMWNLRGAADLLFGGAGMRRGRRDPLKLRRGDALDFWRVEAVEPGRAVRLRAEMRVPGSAMLEFEAVPRAEGGTLLIQTASFDPRGLAGLAYWYVLYPIHQRMFSGMAHAIVKRAESLS